MAVHLLTPAALLRVMIVLSLGVVPCARGQQWGIPPQQSHHAPQQQYDPFGSHWNGAGIGGGPMGSGSPVTLQQDRLMAQQLAGGQRRLYEISVPKGGTVGITVHPRRGAITWNVTHDNVYVMMHPFFTHVLSAPLPGYTGPNGRFRRSKRSASARRGKRQLYSGAVRSNFDFDVTELNAGNGRSLGVGSINYIKEDMGGVYTLEVGNQRMNDVASFYIYATLRPSASPYPRIPDDPQARVGRQEARALNVQWQPVRSQYQARTEYCVFHHEARAHQVADVHSSPYADQFQRPTTIRERCSRRPFGRLSGLRPQTEYHIDVMARDLVTQKMTTYIGVKAATLTPQQHLAQHPNSVNPHIGNNRDTFNFNHNPGPNAMGVDQVPPDLMQPIVDPLPQNDLLPPLLGQGEEILTQVGQEVHEEHIVPPTDEDSRIFGSGASPSASTNTALPVLLAIVCCLAARLAL